MSAHTHLCPAASDYRTSPECSTSAWTVHETCDNDMGCTCMCHRLEAAGWVPPIEAKALRAWREADRGQV